MSKGFRGRTIAQRFADMVRLGEGCWEWLGNHDADGYARFSITGRQQVRAARFAWELFNGPMSPDLVPDHLCLNVRCVNPAHLEPVTTAENVRRAVVSGAHVSVRLAARGACPRGHAFDADNTIRDGRGRKCRLCVNANRRARDRARRGGAPFAA